MTKSKTGSTRRSFRAEYKRDAVQLMRERKALGVSLSQIGRELDVRPDQLRHWARELDEQREDPRPSGMSPGRLPSVEAELRRLKRELEVTRQERGRRA